MTSNGNGTGSNGRLTIISKESLIPAGVVVALLYAAFQIGGVWNERASKIAILTDKVEKLDTRVWVAEQSLTEWRQEVESRLGELPPIDPKQKGKRRSSNESNSMQDHQMRLSSGVGGEDVHHPGSGRRNGTNRRATLQPYQSGGRLCRERAFNRTYSDVAIVLSELDGVDNALGFGF